MPKAIANGLEIEYEVSGPENGPAVLMIMGLAAQLTFWPPALIKKLNDAGLRTIVFDNRDIGKSEKLHTKRSPDPFFHILSARLRIRGMAPYSLEDMARDSVSLLDALGVDKAHVVGVSMGGMIAQVMAADYPERVKSLTAVMSSTNNPKLPRAKPEVAKVLLAPPKPAATPEEALERAMHVWSLIGTKDSGSSKDELKSRLSASYERSNYPSGMRRQLAAIIESGDLRERWTRKVTAPSLVIHGKDDPLSHYKGGVDIAENIEGAELLLVDGMAHDLPKKFLPRIAQKLIDHVDAVENGAAKTRAA